MLDERTEWNENARGTKRNKRNALQKRSSALSGYEGASLTVRIMANR